MLKSEKVEKDIKLPGASREGRPIEIVLAVLSVFSSQGKKEVSLSELQETIAEFQRQFRHVGYSFSSRFLYSLDLLSDLKNLIYNGYIHQYNYRHDGFLPKRFLALTPLGKGRGWKILEMLSEDAVQSLQSAVMIAVKNYESRWRLWSR